jgi:hypothetical protein
MNCRRHGRKPTIALWMLVAAADLALLVAATGVVTMLLIVAALIALAGGVFAVRALSRQPVAPAPASTRPLAATGGRALAPARTLAGGRPLAGGRR